MSGSEWYAEYLESAHWQELRDAKLAEQDYQCERCGEFGTRFRGAWYGMQVHHLTYERVPGNETLADLEALCFCCHKDVHGLADVDERYRDEFRIKMSQRVISRLVGPWNYGGEDIDLEVAAWDEIAEAAGF